MEMDRLLWCVWILFHIHVNGSFGCLESERMGLLEIKACINYPNGTSLRYWDDKENNCCDWLNVECKNGKVIKLLLNGTRENQLGYWYLNSSLFLPFTDLVYLDLSNLGLAGCVEHQGLKISSKLKILRLNYNLLKNVRTLQALGALSSLKVLHIKANQLEGLVTKEGLEGLNDSEELYLDYSSIDANFLQNVGVITSCHWDMLDSTADYQTKFRVVAGGTLFFLSWLLANNTQLGSLNLRNNSFSEPFPFLTSSPYINSIDISDNHIHGQLPINIGSIFPRLSYLNLSRNELEGRIPASLGDLHSLWSLNLSNNYLSGQIPQHFAIGCSSLMFLKLSNNNLDGRMLPDVVNLTSLEFLYLDNKHFERKIPDSLSTASLLTTLDISNNDMSGHLPIWIGNILLGLKVLVMSKNHFQGPVPVEFCQLDQLSLLDLSNNNLSGPIPSCFNSSEIQHVRLNHKKLSGSLTNAFDRCSSLVTLDLRHNNLTGYIPSYIGKLSSLSILLLKSNSLEGEIPVQLCHLEGLSILDLSGNNLSGSITNSFSDIPSEAMHDDAMMVVTQVVEFTTKSKLYAYSGDILDYMSGLDLSRNLLAGEIPSVIGYLSEIHALNLSHNNRIVFSVSHNNLSGRTPDQKAQFSTFEKSSYEGNPLLCGPPIHNTCTKIEPPSTLPHQYSSEEEGFMDFGVFYVTFMVSFIIALLGVIAVLCIDPYWRRAWFHIVEACFYFVLDCFLKLSNKRGVEF
ncbi:cuscuta receptor 1-like [Cornus florida]|uniref:cuscuta receptor 1-like n=1 Tax=Cornus florida TaxID=4283 RepID=UPI00289ED47D|nr:cuscuta receptor 1-like [Cornus florida]